MDKKMGNADRFTGSVRGSKYCRIRRITQLRWAKKNYCWTWTAVDRLAKRFVAFVCGDRSTETGLKLWEKIKIFDVSIFYSDHWKSYNEFVPAEKLVQTKAETYTAESYNSRIRHYLARKTKCYTKSQTMMEISLKLLFLKLNNELYILN
jgi:insertion element IS1 protein InsB